MKNLKLSNYGVKEISKKEAHQINGGGWISYIGGWVTGKLIQVTTKTGEYYNSMGPYYCPLR